MEMCVHQPKRGKKAVGKAKQRAPHEVRRFRHLSLAQDCPLTSSALTLCWTASDCGQKISPGHSPAPASRPVLIVSMQDSLANFVKPVARPVDDGQGTGEQRSWEEKQVIVKQR